MNSTALHARVQPNSWATYVAAIFTVSAAISAICHGATPTVDRPWNEDVIYFVMTDRFCDGDSANNSPEGCDPALYDAEQRDINRYHGGDLRGLERAIESGYFDELGVTALWLTPPLRNAWRSPYDLGGPKTGYHGYWAQDFLDIDPHIVSREGLDGSVYPDTRDGRMSHYRDFVALAHEHGIKVIQDAVCNHVGPLFYYDMNGNGQVELDNPDEWMPPYRDTGYENTHWLDLPEWNLEPPEPHRDLTLLGDPVTSSGLLQNMKVYGRRGFSPDSLGKSDGEEVTCDFFSLRDLYTSPDSEHFDALVDEFVNIYAFYIQSVGIDGLRLDTVKHVHHEFWTAFTHRLRERLGDRADHLLITGEVYDGNPVTLGRYTYSKDPQTGDRTSKTCLDSLLNFQFCFTLRDYLRKAESEFGTGRGLERTTRALNQTGRDAPYNERPGQDGLRPRQKMVNFFENHDGLNRFLVQDVAIEKHHLALAVMMMCEGIPCLYYGSEAALRDTHGQLGRDGETGRITFCPDGNVEALARSRSSETFKLVSQLAKLRGHYQVLTLGRMSTLWVDSDQVTSDAGLHVFARYLDQEDAAGDSHPAFGIVAVNANPAAAASADGIALPFLRSSEASSVELKVIPLVTQSAASSEAQVAAELSVSPDVSTLSVTIPPSSAVLILETPSHE